MGQGNARTGVGQYGGDQQRYNTFGSYGTGGPHEPNSLGNAPHSNRYQAAAPQQPVAQSYAPPQPAQAPPQVQATAQADGNSNDQQEQDDNVANLRSQGAQSQGFEKGTTNPADAILGGLGFLSGVPGLGTLASTLSGNITGSDYKPTTYGNEGTIGSLGGVFDEQGREYDSTTGQALNSYGSKGDFLNSQYVNGIRDNPFSVDSYLSDPGNTRGAIAQRGRGLSDTGYDDDGFDGLEPGANAGPQISGQASSGFGDALAFQDGLGSNAAYDVNAPVDRNKLAAYTGQVNNGFQEHTVTPGSATNFALQGIGGGQGTGDKNGAAIAGSQYSSTGNFSSNTSDENDPGAAGQSLSNAGGSFAGDDPSTFEESDSGGGGGGGK